MYHDAISVKCRDDFTIEVSFDDGKSGIIDCKPLIAKGGIFSRLSNPQVFKRARINQDLGVVTWDDEVDIAPETAYSLATGSPLPQWMEGSEPAVR